MPSLTRKRDNIHWSMQNLLSYNKTYNFAVSGRGPGKTTDMMRYLMVLHKKGYMLIIIKRQIVDVNETTISDFANAYNVLQEDEKKIKLVWKKGDMKTGIVDVYIEGEDVPFFRMVALSNPKYRLKGMAFDRPLGLVVFDEYKVSGKEKYIKDEYSQFTEFYATLCRWTELDNEGFNKPLRCLFLGNNYSLTDPYMANMQIPVNKIRPGKILVGETWAFEDIKINEELRQLLLKQNPLFRFGDDAYTKYALDGIAVDDERLIVVEKQPDNFKLAYIFYIENKYLGIYWNTADKKDFVFWVSILNNYDGKRKDITCFDYTSLVDGTHLISRAESVKFAVLKRAFEWRDIAYKSVYEGYLFEQIYDNI